MTQAEETPRKQFAAFTGTVLNYSDTFTAVGTADVKVLNSGVQISSDDYTVVVATGIVTLDSSVTDKDMTVYRETSIKNTTIFAVGISIKPGQLDDLFDNQVRILQELRDKTDRGLKYNESIDLTTADLTLAKAETGKAIGWDVNGDLININL